MAKVKKLMGSNVERIQTETGKIKLIENGKIVLKKGEIVTIRATQDTYLKYTDKEIEMSFIFIDNKEVK